MVSVYINWLTILRSNSLYIKKIFANWWFTLCYVYPPVTELPVAHSGRRPLRPAPQPPTATYENVEESDLPIYCNSIVDRHEDSQPVTFHPRNAWRQ